MQTADYVRGAGGQAEFRVGVQQAGNAYFAFLRPGDALHAYYRWILRADPQARRRAVPGRTPRADDVSVGSCARSRTHIREIRK